ITTPDIATSFDNGMEFFSTFGGNTVSCAIGLAVLKVVQEENLQDHALTVGEQLLNGIRELQRHYEIIGDVRGSGLFLGVELTIDGQPATQEAKRIVNTMRNNGILIGTDGPFNSVLKIRPPMPFSTADATTFLDVLQRVLKHE
ncbi:MAG TPA: aminotransferase class III-fold pyridoxal phosphate-dependent enzyme, partial [Pyrinomonadaceae bacterium]|nr:aminotransferase class III-fold pyridoxal phosphate-dependent enzyme [Pyrinomonadaceae bacterium]